ncbi:alkaline phosphatase D family protein [Microlunatus sp. GCM10028923]|uniref:alkaline phosphatase D family protein n=1 Tax=Microlunatus sp. GCM10028923 TaxID=3273400 RepID=UPI00360C602E
MIKTGLATATTAALAFSTRGAAAAPAPRQNPFTLGVASGDPWPTSVILWTRLALDPLAEDGRGGMPERDYELVWQVATDRGFRTVIKSGRAVARPAYGHAVHVEVTGLQPGREYWYRFRQGSYLSEPALTRTAPGRGETPKSLAMSFVSCSQYEHGWFTAYRRLAEDQPELILHLGDYQYEYKAGAYVAPTGNVRDHAGPETTDLATYRQRHAQYKSDPDLQAAHAIAPWLVIWDDHETDNNWADEMPEKPAEAGPAFLERRAAAFRAYYENMPLRPSSAPEGIDLLLYRRIHWGELATFHMLDTRQYRDDQGCGDGYKTDCPEAVDPARTITGDDQEAWLLDGFRQSKARWDVIGQQVFFAQRDNNVSPDIKTVSMDGWDGYQASRERITRGWLDGGVRNPVVLTGDVHAHWASDLKIDYDDPDGAVVGSELVCSSITSGGDGADSATPHPWLGWNQHLKFQNNLRGYVNTTITADQLDADFRCLSKVSVADQAVFTRRSYKIVDGERGLQQTADNPPAAARTSGPSTDEITRETVAWETERP